MSARDRFVQTRKAVIELDMVKARLSEGGEDWRPEGVKSTAVGDPTGNQAVYNVDVLGDMLIELRNRESELEYFIGVSLMLIDRVREGLGAEYADILEQRYIDVLPWCDVTVDGEIVTRATGKRRVSVAFDWIDSLGLAKLLAHDYEI